MSRKKTNKRTKKNCDSLENLNQIIMHRVNITIYISYVYGMLTIIYVMIVSLDTFVYILTITAFNICGGK